MRNIVVLFAGLFFTGFVSIAQQTGEEVRKEVKREVRLKEVNGEKQLIITTTENGLSIGEIYRGEEAEQKLEELKKEGMVDLAEGSEREKQLEVHVEENERGKLIVKVITIENGERVEELYKGRKAKKKLKEIEGDM